MRWNWCGSKAHSLVDAYFENRMMKRPCQFQLMSVAMVTIVVLNCAAGQLVRFVDESFNVVEGQQFTVRVEILGTITQNVRVIVQIENDAESDFIGDTQVATFHPSSMISFVTFTVRDDDEPENKELFYLKFFLLSSELYLGSPSTASIAVEASDDAFGVFGFLEVSPVLATEELYTSMVNIRIQRTVSYFMQIAVTFEINSTSENGIVGVDIAPATGSVSFLPNQREAILQLQILPDSVPENDESFLVKLIKASFDATINVTEVTLIIKANDSPIRFSQGSYTYDEGPGTKSWNVNVTRGLDASDNLTGPLSGTVTVRYRFEIFTADLGLDFTAANGELVFGAGETRKTVAFDIIDDDIPEINEVFKIRLLTLAGDAVFVNPSVAEVAIRANDYSSGVITFKPVSEGNTATPQININEDTFTVASFTVLRMAGTFGEVSLGWYVQRSDNKGDAVNQDVGPVEGRLVFADGENMKEIQLTVVQDSLPEPSEQFDVFLQPDNLTGSAEVRGITMAQLVIEDSDNVYGTVEFGPVFSHTIDTNTRPRHLRLSVTRNGAQMGDAVVNISVSYIDDGIEALPDNIFEEWIMTVTLPANQGQIIVNIIILPSAFLTIGGQFLATLHNLHLSVESEYGAYNSPSLGTQQQVTVVVSESEANGESGFNSTADIVVEEPDSGILQVPLLIIREGMSGTAAIRWSLSGEGNSAKTVNQSDVTALAGTVNIESGTFSVDLVISVQADDTPEVDELMIVRLESIEPSSTQRLRSGATEIHITVIANDNPGGIFQFASVMQDAYTISEGVDPLEVVVERTGGDLITQRVQFVVEPNGTREFYGSPNALLFAPGVQTQSVTILARNEGEPELAEFFTLRLIPLDNSTLGERITISITVRESDFPYGLIQFKEDPTILFIPETVAGYPVNISVVVERDRGTFSEVTVPWTLSPATEADLRPSNGTIVFYPGQTGYTLVLQTVNDEISERDETYAVQLSQPTGGAVLGIPAVGAIIITENDNPIIFTETLVYIEEPGTRQLTVQRSGKLDVEVSVAYRTLDGSASALEADYQEIYHETLSFASGESRKNLSVTVLDDSIPEGNETFTLQLFDASDDMLITSSSRATLVILANDNAYGVFSFEVPSNNRVEEGSTIYYHINRSQGIFGEVEVSWEIHTLQNITLPEGSEFQSTRGTVLFQAQEARLALPITPLDDQQPEGQEVFRLVLTAVKVVTGLSGRTLASLAASNLQMDIVVLASDEPSGLFAFPVSSQDLSVAEDYDFGHEVTTTTTYTIERRQGTDGTAKVLWQIFSEPFGTNLPQVYDLTFIGQHSAAVSVDPSNQRNGFGTPIFEFSDSAGSYMTIASDLEPTAEALSEGFSISAWVQPSPLCNGYIVARSTDDGTSHYYSLRLIATSTSTTLNLTITAQSSEPNEISSAVSGTVVQNGHWHHIVVTVANTSVQFYLDGILIGSSTVTSGSPQSGAGALWVGAQPSGSDYFVGYMQDVRIWARPLGPSEAESLYLTPALKDVSPVSGVLTYEPGIRMESFRVHSLQDIEEEGAEVFSVMLVSATGGARLSLAESRTTLTVLKSDNANGLFGFREPCLPAHFGNESGLIRCSVLRQRGDDGNVEVLWLIQQKTSQGLSSAVSDFVNATGSVTFLRGERLKTFEAQVTEDKLPELDELFEISLAAVKSDDGLVGSTNSSGASIDPETQYSEVTIEASDFPYGLLQFGMEIGVPPTGEDGLMISPANEKLSVTVGEEGGIVSLVVERAQGTLGTISVEWRTIDKTALSSGKTPPDYVGSVGRVDFVDGQTYAFINITVIDNGIPEGEKTFQVELVNPTGGAALGVASSALVTINASDNAFGEYQFSDDSLTVMAEETGDVGYKSVFLKVLRLGGTVGSDTVSWTASEEQDDGLDLTEHSGTLSFTAGQSEASLEIRISGDTQPELDEKVTVRLTRVTQGALGDSLKLTSTVTIAANDEPYGYFVTSRLQRPVRVEETSANVNITVHRLYGTFGRVIVSYQTLAPNEAYSYLPGLLDRADYEDFNRVSSNVTFQAGEEYGNFSVRILDDTNIEQDESVFVRLTAATLLQAAQTRPVINSPRLGPESDSYAQIIIASNDNANGMLQLAPASLTVAEAVGVPEIRVVRLGGTYGEVSVQWRAISGEAQDMQDFSLLSHEVVLSAGETSKLLPLVIVDDPIPELSETFMVELLDQVTGGASLGENRTAVITIEFSDDPIGVFGFASDGQSVQEPENGQPYSVNITVVRIGGSIGVVSLQWSATFNGEIPDNDISPTSGAIFFVSNEASHRITVSILPDDVSEGTENIIFTLISADNGGRIGERNTFRLSIVPNDSPHGIVQFALREYTVQEGSSEKQYLNLIRSGGKYGQLRVFYSTKAMDIVSVATKDGSTTLSYFSAPLPGRLAGEGTAVNLTGVTDYLQACSSVCLAIEVCQSFQLGSTGAGTTCAWFSSSAENSLMLAAANFSVYNKDAEKIQRVISSIARQGEDYSTVIEGSFLIQDRNTTGQLPVVIYDDSIPELNEQFNVLLLRVEVTDSETLNQDDPRIGNLSSALVTISSSDNANGLFRIYSDSPTGNLQKKTVSYEEQNRLAVDLIVEREGGSIGEVTITWQVNSEGRTATYGTDFVADGAKLTFTPGQTRKIITATILDDTLPEDDESFTIQLTSPVGGAIIGSDNNITVIILANDNVAGVLSFNTTSIQAAEGEQFVVGVLRGSSQLGTVRVSWTIEGLNGLQPQLTFRNYNGFLTFLPGDSQKTIALSVLSDDKPEVNEEYRLKLVGINTYGVSPTGSAIISPLYGMASITIQGSNDPHGVLQFASTSLAITVVEEVGSALLQVDRKFGSIGTVRLVYRVIQGTLSQQNENFRLAAAGQDFIAASNTVVNIPSGTTSATISVTIVDDRLPEIDEVFLVQLTSVTLVGSEYGTSLPRLASNGTVAQVTIKANDGAQGVIVFAEDSRNVSVDEVVPNITLKVLRTLGTYGQVSVFYYSQGITADTNEQADFRLLPGVITFAAGESQKDIRIEIINDALPEPNEQFEVVLSNTRNGATLGQFSRATVTILANDAAAGQVNFASPTRVELQEPVGGNQASSKVELSLRRGPGIYGRVTVPFIVTNLFNVPSGDLSPASGKFIFEDRQAIAVIELSAVDDNDPEPEEEFIVKLQTADNGATLGPVTTATVIVRASDFPYGLFEIYPVITRLPHLDVEENVGTVALDVMRSGGLQGQVSVDVVTNSGTATSVFSNTNIILAELQSVPVSNISAWHVINTGAVTFVLLLTSLRADQQLRNLLPAMSPVETGQSVLYRWQGELTYIKTLATDGATAADSFRIGNNSYFVIANSGKEGAREVQSVLYRIDDDGSVNLVQGLTTYGATDVEYFVNKGIHHLAIANSLDDNSQSDLSLFIYTWDSTTQKFGISPSQQLPTLFAKAVEVFVISDIVYIAIANYYSRASSSYEINSIVYRKEASGFVQHQHLATKGASDITFFTVNGMHCLVMGNNRQDVISSPQTSQLFHWDPTTQKFLHYQDISTTRVATIRALTLQNGTVLLAIANSVGTSEVLRWNISQSRFETAWTGKPYHLFEPLSIQQPAGALDILAAADVIAENSGALYQVAQTANQSDYVQRRMTLTFQPNQTKVHTTVLVLQDDVPEDTEFFTVDIVNPRNGAEIGPQGSVRINILSNDNAHGIIQFAPDSVKVYATEKDDSNNTILLRVMRAGGYFGHVAVQWMATGDDGLQDISPLSGTVEFADGLAVATIALTILDDKIAEFAEVVYIRLAQIVEDGTANPSRGARLGEVTLATVTVQASDSPYGVTAWKDSSIVTTEPTGTDQIVNLTIVREQGLQGELRVSYVTSMDLRLPAQQQATSGEDFVPMQGSVSISPGAREASIQIVIKQDVIPEVSETFLVNLTDVELVGSGGDNPAQPSIRIPGNVVQVTILENDNAQGTVQFDMETNVEGRIDSYEEYGRNNTVTLTLRRYVGLFGVLLVSWQTASISANNLDFFPSFGSVMFADRQETAELVITIIDDQLPEGMESFDVKLIHVSGDAVLGSVTSIRIAILKNDSPTGLYRFSTREVEIQEIQALGDRRSIASLVVQRVQGTQGFVNVQWRLSVDAQDDFMPPLQGTLQFEQGQAEQTITLQSRPDDILEGREVFVVSLVSADNNADISSTEGDATIVILSDPGASGTISIVPASRSVLIGEPGEYSPVYDGTAEIELSRGKGIYGEVVVQWAITPRDTTAFMQVEGSVTFLDLQQMANITLQARDDSNPELKASFTLQINSASGGAVISPETQAARSNILFVASDYPHGLFVFTPPETMSVSENMTLIQVTVYRDKGSVGQVQVSYTTTEGTASSGQDFYPAAGMLVFQNGIDYQPIRVSLRPDSIPEGPETFFINITSVELLNPSNNNYSQVGDLQRDMPPAIGALAVKTIVVEKNDNAEGIVEFKDTAVDVREDAAVAHIAVIRREGNYGVVTIDYETNPISASSGVDYRPVSGTLRLEDGQVEGVINVTLVDDTEREFAEQFSITLSNPIGGVLLGNDRTAVVTIIKSDYPNGKFSFLGEVNLSIPNPEIEQSVVLHIERTEGVLGQQELSWRIMGPNNPNLRLYDTSDISYTSNWVETTSGYLTWNDGEAGSKQFSLIIKPYSSWEVAKTFVIEIYNIRATPQAVGNGEASPTAGQVMLTVEKFGDPNGIIEFYGEARSDRTVEEPAGSQLQELGFPVVRQTGTGVTGVVEIHWEVHSSDAQVSDVRPRNGTLLLADGQRQGQITLQILPDDVPELTEEFSLMITSVEGGADLNPVANQAVFRIRYSDNPHGLFGVTSDKQEVAIDPVDMSRSLALNFSRYAGTFGSAIVTYNVKYNEPLSGITLSSSTGTITFANGQQNAAVSIPLRGDGFLKLNSVFIVSLVDVQFVGSGVTEAPQLIAGETEAEIRVTSSAANSEVSFLNTIINVNDGENTATLTITRSGTYGSISVGWTTGQFEANLPPGVTNGEITPITGSVSIAHGVENKNFTVQVNAKIGQAEMFMVRLPRAPETSASGGARLAGQNLGATLDPAGAVQFMPASLSPTVTELDKQVTVRICRLYGVIGRIEITYSTEDITAHGNFDYRSSVQNVVILQPGQAISNFSIMIFTDTIPEESEKFFVHLTKVGPLPTPTQSVISPRLSSLFISSTVTITESNDPYGVLWIETAVVSTEEAFINVPLSVRRTGGLFGSVSVRVRTVGGGESWTTDIVPSIDNVTRDTIAQALGQRSTNSIATGGLDYSVLDRLITFETGISQQMVPLVLLNDDVPEPEETVLVYLTQVTGGARVAVGSPDGGLKGYSEIIIEPSDLSNGLIGFAENSKNVEANEDLNPVVILTLIRLNAYYGDVRVFWKAKLRETSSETEDIPLTNQLQALAGVTTCLADVSTCTLEVKLIDDVIPEESFTFVVKLENVGTDAELNNASIFANITVLPSDHVRGLVQFEANSRVKIVGENANTLRLGVERVQGLNYDVTVGYTTRMMTFSTTFAGITTFPAVDGEDYVGQQGTLIFRKLTQAIQFINVTLTPEVASRNPYPKQFYIHIHNPTNGASVSGDFNRSIVRIVDEKEVDVWTVVTSQEQRPFNNTNLLITLGALGARAQDTMTDNEVAVMDNMVERINLEGNKRPLPDEVLDSMMNLLCKLLEPTKVDATRGHHSLAQRLEEFAHNMLVGSGCPALSVDELFSKSCPYVKVSAGRWKLFNLRGYSYEALHKDTFDVPNELTVSTGADGTDDECVDFHFIEYGSRLWFPTQNGEQLLNNRIISFGLKGVESSPISEPVKFRIHTADSRIATKRARCVYFDTSLAQWLNPFGVCNVENNLNTATDDFVDCACSHMTSYAVIAQVYDPGIIGYTLWFFIACFICMSCLLLVIVSHHLCYRQPTFAACLLQHILFAVLITHLCLVVDAFFSPTEILTASMQGDNYRCIVMGLFLHYFFLAQFMWIFVQSINLWKILVMNDEHTDRKYVWFFLHGWGVPLAYIAVFYAITYNIYKYETDLKFDYIYGDVNNNGEICFLTNAYAAVGGIILPVLLLLLLSGVIFIKAFQLLPQWRAYDDIYRGHYNNTEVRLLLLLWSVIVMTWLWGGLHMVYGQLWMLVIFCICDILMGVLAFILYAILRNPLLMRCSPTQKSYYTAPNTDVGTLPSSSLAFSHHLASSNGSINMRGSRASLINDAWDSSTPRGKVQMTVKRALPSQVYLNPPVAVVSPASNAAFEHEEFEDVLFALKMGQSLTPSELSRSMADDDDSQLSGKLDHYETKRVDIADTHL